MMIILKRLLGCIREYKLPTFLTLAFILGEAIIETLIPTKTADLINEVQQGSGINAIVTSGVILAIMALCSLACGAIAGFTCSKAATGLSKNLRHDMFERVQTFSFQNIDKFSSSSLVTRMTTDVNNVQMAFMMIIRMGLRSPLMFILSTIAAFRMGGMLAMAFVVVIPLLAFGLILIGKFAMPAFRSVFKKYDHLNESIEENVRGMRVVKGFSREEHEKEKFGNANEDIRRDFTRAERIVAMNQPLMSLCMYFDMVFILSLGAKMAIVDQTINIGQISAMITYGVQILMSLMFLSMIYVMVTMSAESLKRICEVLEEEPTLHNPENPVMEVPDGSVVFKNVEFSYFDKYEEPVLKDINVNIPSGTTVGIIGPTGSGKTTLVNLLSRLYDVNGGSVEVGGHDVREYDIRTLRDSVSVVLQKNVLFSGSIYDNLRWGDKNATDEECQRAAKLACADEFIDRMPDGYDTWIEQGGTNVSGGQRQRLCIARALMKKPKVLVLDDSTSAVDTATDAKIRRAFREEIPGTTKFIIAQRISSVQDADMILIMDDGKIAARGTHEELLKTSEMYRELYESQTGQGSGDFDRTAGKEGE